jgi:ATP-binding cassette subfamily B protein
MTEKKAHYKTRFAVIFKYLRRYRNYLFFGGLAVIGANTLLLVNPYLLKVAFDKLEMKSPSSEILTIAALIVALSIASGVFRFSMRRSIIWMSRKLEYNLRYELFWHLLKLTPSFYHNNRTGDIMARATNDIEAVRAMIGPGIMHIANTVVSSIIAISFMVYLSPKLTLYSLIPMPILSLIVNRLGMTVHRRYMKIQEYFAVLTSRVQENLAGVRVVRAYNQETPETEDFARHCKNYMGLNMSMIKIYAMLYPILFMLGGTVSLIVLYSGGRAVIQETITLGTLVAFFAYLAMLIWPMIALGWVVALYQRGTASLDRINRVLHTSPDVSSQPDARKYVTVEGRIEFRNLDFAYNGTKVLHDINLVIEPGMTVGIVGPTGSGKSTLVSLIGRLYPLPRGKLSIDDIDVNDWDIETLRSQIGFVPQEPFLFSNTIANNILFGSDSGDGSLARKAAATAVIDGEIEEFPNGYETVLGERGITLSGGQKQRVSIARAIVTDPRILILDDATSSVDTETEHMIGLRLRGEISKRTSIIISHRASAVKDADLIIYMESGTIAESGTHEQLMAGKGRYERLYRTQLIEQELERM